MAILEEPGQLACLRNHPDGGGQVPGGLAGDRGRGRPDQSQGLQIGGGRRLRGGGAGTSRPWRTAARQTGDWVRGSAASRRPIQRWGPAVRVPAVSNYGLPPAEARTV